MGFNIIGAHTDDLLQAHRDTVAEIAAATDPVNLRTYLAALDAELSNRLVIARIDPSQTGVLEQLVGRDEVHEHGARNVDELQALRIGRAGDQKICVGLLNPDAKSGIPQLLAAIYIYKQTSAIPFNAGTPDYTALAGNIPDIINPPCRPVEDIISALICYSVTGIKMDDNKTPVLKGAGERLINMLLPLIVEMIARGELPKDIIISTLSPLRGLVAENKGTDLSALDRVALTTTAVKYLLTGKNAVQRFHGGNGIKIGDVKLAANTPDSLDGILAAGVMMNCVYDLLAEVRAERRRLFRANDHAALLAPHLQAYLPIATAPHTLHTAAHVAAETPRPQA